VWEYWVVDYLGYQLFVEGMVDYLGYQLFVEGMAEYVVAFQYAVVR